MELPAVQTSSFLFYVYDFKVQKASLDCFLKMLVTLYPTGPEQSVIFLEYFVLDDTLILFSFKQSAKGVYEAVIRVLEEDTAAPHKFLSDKIVNKVRAAYPAPLKVRATFECRCYAYLYVYFISYVFLF